MFERIIVTAVLIGLGVLAYRLLLSVQYQRAIGAADGGGATKPALMVFTSPTCAPCKLQQIPIIDRIMIDQHDRIDLRVIDVTERPAELEVGQFLLALHCGQLEGVGREAPQRRRPGEGVGPLREA